MTVYLDLDDLLLVAARAVDGKVVVRDYGLLESAVARPKTMVGRKPLLAQDIAADGRAEGLLCLHGPGVGAA